VASTLAKVSVIRLPMSNAKYRPSEIRIPKMPPNVPRSRRWNQAALTFTIETAPKLWKYMFTL
jgi:hypothetical protein